MGKPWFHPKAYGYGAGLPCSWEGWLTLAVFLAVAIAARPLLEISPIGYSAAAHAGVIGADVVAFVAICAVKTRGGWRWRWGQGE
ncbi:MAG: hypothetical protein ACOY4K_14230 [Pseudomonadota bacterium]